MSWLLPVLLAIAILIILVAKTSQQQRQGKVGLPYQSGPPLFSPAERAFLDVLEHAVGPQHRVFGKVRLADLVALQPGLDPRARQGALNRIAFKHVDFVVCTVDDLSVVCLAELNDRSHNSRKAQERDDLVRRVCHTVGLPLLVFPAQASYTMAKVREDFLAATQQHRLTASPREPYLSEE